MNEFMACETMTSNNSININVCVLNLVQQMSASVFTGSFFSRPGCSKLTTSLVNVSLNFQKLISQICQ